MSLPTTSQVMSVTRHVATFAAGVIVMFGLSTKISPDQVTAIINMTGTLVNDLILLIGAVTPIIVTLYGAKAAGITSQLQTVTTDPTIKIEGRILAPSAVAEAVPSAQVVADPAEPKKTP